MLRNLTIRNYALIESLELEFGSGLTIITGETGAGKSIMLGALGLVMGGRADTKVISDSSRKSIVEAVFTNPDPDLRGVLAEKGIDWIVSESGTAEIVIRRELSASGRSRIFVNDNSVTLQTLQAIVPRLIDIHSQHANAKINDSSERLRIIDSMAGDREERERYREAFDRYAEITRRIRRMREEAAQDAANLSYLQFQLAQLDKLQPKGGELQEIERTFEVLSDADEIKERLARLISVLGDSRGSLGENIGEAIALAEKSGIDRFTQAKDINPSITGRLRAIALETRDILGTVEDMNSSIDSDPAALARLSERMNLYYEAIKTFRVKDSDELADLHERIKRKVASVTTGNDELPALEKESRKLAKDLRDKAETLSEVRGKAAGAFSDSLMATARPLGLPHINFAASLAKRKLTSDGQDDVEFMCAFNKNSQLQPIGEIASGGEIARMMLSMKSIMAGHINLPTIIFDEVDTGVSGEIADKMGRMMHSVSEKMQVIVITHLPQVASKGDSHFKVYKSDEGERTVTHVKELGKEERIKELAGMISGSEVTPAAMNAAKNLLKWK